ncbi:MAG: inositol monophosphatase family protein [Frankiaceae bacterium]
MTAPSRAAGGADPGELLALATAVAREAGALVLDRGGVGGGATAVGTKSSSTDVVTATDRAAEALIVQRLRAARPGDAVLGEEGGAQGSSASGVRWLVDPLDGTVNYLYGIPQYAVSLAAEVDGEVVAGVVLDPAKDELYAATLGGGATRNGRPIRCSDRAELGQALVATGFSYDADRRARQAAALARLLPAVRDIRRMGAAALDLCAVACGRVDAYYEKALHPWDVAAGALIAREAGARVGTLQGAPDGSSFTGDFLLATAPGVHDALRRLLAELGADRD